MYNVQLPLLMIGDKGGYVKAAQTLLIALGYDCGNKPLNGTEKADGDFGRSTERAVAFFQSKNNLEVDGEVGGATWAALLKF
jgi:peptidoglycan hydrolase-like protein with peptidoglycan-binding domain